MTDKPYLEHRPLPGKWLSLSLTVAVHLGLAAFLFFGIRWQSQPPAAMEVALVAAPVPAPAVVTPPRPAPKPEPKPEPRPAPKPEPRPEPPKPAPKPEPKPEPKPHPKPEPKPEPKPQSKPEPKPEPKPQAKPEPKPEPKPITPPRDDYMAQMLAQESERLAIENMMRADARQAGTPGTDPGYSDRIAARVRSRLVRPPGIAGNPEAIFSVEQMPDGTILSVRLRKSSGIPELDAAIERAINASNPLPTPTSGPTERLLELKFRPNED